ncbi:hypothetical protein [Myceligenerans cantabricum]
MDEQTGGRRRRQGLAIAIVASVVLGVVVCSVGLVLANRGEDPERTPSLAVVSPLPIPMIVSSDDLDVAGADLPARVAKAAERLAETVEAGEKVYEAARPTAPRPALRRLRTALDEATDALGHEGVGDTPTKRLKALKTLRTNILDAASEITDVRDVPGSELPEGKTTATVTPGGTGATPSPDDTSDSTGPSISHGGTSGGSGDGKTGGTGDGDDDGGNDDGDDNDGGKDGGENGEDEPQPTTPAPGPTVTVSPSPSRSATSDPSPPAPAASVSSPGSSLNPAPPPAASPAVS